MSAGGQVIQGKGTGAQGDELMIESDGDDDDSDEDYWVTKIHYLNSINVHILLFVQSFLST